MKQEIRIGGTGGMGVVLAGLIIGHAAILSGLNAVQSQSYGSEARGTAAKSEVIISDGDIHYPEVRKSDILVAMSQKALEMYLPSAKDGSVVIVDPDLVDSTRLDSQYQVFGVPAMKTADELGLRLVSNMVMLGAIAKKIGMISDEALEEAVKASVPERYLDLNLRAVHAGSNLL